MGTMFAPIAYDGFCLRNTFLELQTSEPLECNAFRRQISEPLPDRSNCLFFDEPGEADQPKASGGDRLNFEPACENTCGFGSRSANNSDASEATDELQTLSDASLSLSDNESWRESPSTDLSDRSTAASEGLDAAPTGAAVEGNGVDFAARSSPVTLELWGLVTEDSLRKHGESELGTSGHLRDQDSAGPIRQKYASGGGPHIAAVHWSQRSRHSHSATITRAHEEVRAGGRTARKRRSFRRSTVTAPLKQPIATRINSVWDSLMNLPAFSDCGNRQQPAAGSVPGDWQLHSDCGSPLGVAPR